MKKILTIALLTASFAEGAYSQQVAESAEAKDVELVESKDKKLGWAFKNELALGVNLLSNKNVSGQADGETRIYSLKLNFDAEEIQNQSEWLTNVAIDESMSQTPTVPRYIKSSDELKVSSIYKHFLRQVSWLGAFAKFQVNAPIMDGYSEQATEKDFLIVDRDGKSTQTRTDRLKLTDGFKPLTLKESLGAVAKLSSKKEATFEIRSGLGARQILAADQLEVADNADTPTIEVVTRENISIVGFEMLAELKGILLEDKMTYNIYSEALMPVSYSPKIDDAPENSKLISTETGVKVNYGVTKWAALVYDFKSKREPLVKSHAEVTQSFLVTVSLKNNF